MKNYHTKITALALSTLLAMAAPSLADSTATAFSPDLIILKLQQPADSLSLPPNWPRVITADSADFASPPLRAAIAGNIATVEIVPKMPVDSVMLIARHSQTLTDTLGVAKAPPYMFEWNCAAVPDQDQTHLQFGYALYSGDSLVVNSPPLPHRWSLDRGKRLASKKSYLARLQNTIGEFDADCLLGKWREVKAEELGHGSYFKMLCTASRLHFIAVVRDSDVTAQDFVELHVDMHRDRAQFPGINHRSIRFSPRARVITFAGVFKDGAYARSDSVAMLIADEMDWKTVTDSAGYIVEAAIPLAALSDVAAMPTKIGLDVSIMNVDNLAKSDNSGSSSIDGAGTATTYYSWSGSERFTRYSPKSWATVRIGDGSLAIRVAMATLLILMGIAVVAVFAYLFLSHRQESKQLQMEVKAEENSPLTEAVIECVDKRLDDAGFGVKDVLAVIDKTEEEVNKALTQDLECTFDQLLLFRRIKHSQRLMRDASLSIEKIAAMCGFADVAVYKELFKSRMSVDPEVSRVAMLERIREDLEAEAEDDDDDDAY